MSVNGHIHIHGNEDEEPFVSLRYYRNRLEVMRMQIREIEERLMTIRQNNLENMDEDQRMDIEEMEKQVRNTVDEGQQIEDLIDEIEDDIRHSIQQRNVVLNPNDD